MSLREEISKILFDNVVPSWAFSPVFEADEYIYSEIIWTEVADEIINKVLDKAIQASKQSCSELRMTELDTHYIATAIQALKEGK